MFESCPPLNSEQKENESIFLGLAETFKENEVGLVKLDQLINGLEQEKKEHENRLKQAQDVISNFFEGESIDPKAISKHQRERRESRVEIEYLDEDLSALRQKRLKMGRQLTVDKEKLDQHRYAAITGYIKTVIECELDKLDLRAIAHALGCYRSDPGRMYQLNEIHKYEGKERKEVLAELAEDYLLKKLRTVMSEVGSDVFNYPALSNLQPLALKAELPRELTPAERRYVEISEAERLKDLQESLVSRR